MTLQEIRKDLQVLPTAAHFYIAAGETVEGITVKHSGITTPKGIIGAYHLQKVLKTYHVLTLTRGAVNNYATFTHNCYLVNIKAGLPKELAEFYKYMFAARILLEEELNSKEITLAYHIAKAAYYETDLNPQALLKVSDLEEWQKDTKYEIENNVPLANPIAFKG